MKDQFQREIDYIRISITDRCNLCCRYCRPDHIDHLSHNDILTYEEILTLCRIFVKLGIHKFKITGGEPLVRKDCISFIRQLKKLPGVSSVTLTTNGIKLKDSIKELAESEIDGVNVSLDSLNSKTYKKITGTDVVEIVKDAIIAASEAGLSVKINTVLESETSMEDIWAFIDFVKNHRVPVRFIERMPMGFEYEDFSILDKEAILTKIIKKGIRIEKISDTSSIGNGPATYYKLDGYDGLIGFIEALHGKFCHMCNRIRLTSAGQLKPCLYYPETLNLRDMIRNKYDEDEMMQEIKKAIYEKPKSHDFEKEPSEVNMSSIGG